MIFIKNLIFFSLTFLAIYTLSLSAGSSVLLENYDFLDKTNQLESALSSQSPDSSKTLAEYVNLIVNLTFGIGFAAAVILIIWGGVEYVGSSFLKKAEGKKRITNAFIGLAILFSSFIFFEVFNPELKIVRFKPLTVGGESQDHGFGSFFGEEVGGVEFMSIANGKYIKFREEMVEAGYKPEKSKTLSGCREDASKHVVHSKGCIEVPVYTGAPDGSFLEKVNNLGEILTHYEAFYYLNEKESKGFETVKACESARRSDGREKAQECGSYDGFRSGGIFDRGASPTGGIFDRGASPKSKYSYKYKE